MRRYISLAAFIVIVALVAWASGQFMPGAWYGGLAKPGWTPPNWLFGPVWSVLYLMIAVAGWLIWRAQQAAGARWLWAAQLGLNGAWSPIMFGLQRIDLALAVIVVLWLSIAGLVVASWRPARLAALLLVPYLAWVSYAAALNLAIWRLN